MPSGTRRDRDKKKIHPVWRGVGCILMVLAPIGGYYVSNWAINYLLENFPQFTARLARGEYPPNTMLYMHIGGTIIAGAILFFILVLISSFLVSIWGEDEIKPSDEYRSYRSGGQH